MCDDGDADRAGPWLSAANPHCRGLLLRRFGEVGCRHMLDDLRKIALCIDVVDARYQAASFRSVAEFASSSLPRVISSRTLTIDPTSFSQTVSVHSQNPEQKSKA